MSSYIKLKYGLEIYRQIVAKYSVVYAELKYDKKNNTLKI